MKRVAIPLLCAILFISLVAVLVVRDLKVSPQGARGTSREYIIPPEAFESGGFAPYTIAARIPLKLESPTGIAAGPDGSIYVCGEQEIVVISESGQILARRTLDRPARCIAVDAEGNAYVGLADAVAVFPPDLSRSSEWATLDERSIITSIAVDRGRVYAADAGTRKVWEFDAGGMLRGFIDENFIIPSPYFDVAVDPAGDLWIADTGRHTLLKMSRDGEVVGKWGQYAMDVKGFSGCCNPAHFAILPDGRFVTAEKGLQRIKIHTAGGDFAGLVETTQALGGAPQGLDIAVTASGDIYVLRSASGEIVAYRREGA